MNTSRQIKITKDYFLFFQNLKMLVNIKRFRNKSSKNISNSEYSEIIDEDENDKKEI